MFDICTYCVFTLYGSIAWYNFKICNLKHVCCKFWIFLSFFFRRLEKVLGDSPGNLVGLDKDDMQFQYYGGITDVSDMDFPSVSRQRFRGCIKKVLYDGSSKNFIDSVSKAGVVSGCVPSVSWYVHATVFYFIVFLVLPHKQPTDENSSGSVSPSPTPHPPPHLTMPPDFVIFMQDLCRIK